jgi:hypothetical protein
MRGKIAIADIAIELFAAAIVLVLFFTGKIGYALAIVGLIMALSINLPFKPSKRKL